MFKCIFELSNFPPYAYKLKKYLFLFLLIFFRVLATLSAKDLILNTNAFIDYIIYRSQNLDSQNSEHYERVIIFLYF